MTNGSDAGDRPRPDFDLRRALGDEVPGADATTALLLLWSARAARVTELFLQRALRDHDLDSSEYAALGALLLTGPPHRMSPTDLAGVLAQTSGGMTKTIARLVDDGLVRRVRDPDDGRRNAVELTDEGARRARAAVEELTGSLSAALSDGRGARRTELVDALRELLTAMERAADVRPSA